MILLLAFTAYAVGTVTFSLSGNTVSEGAGSGTAIGDFQLTSADTNPVYSLADGVGDNANFSVGDSSLYAADAFDYESKNSYTIVVDVTADNEATGQETFVIQVANVAPVAGNDEITVAEDDSVSGTLPVSGDDSSVVFSVTGEPAQGAVSVSAETGAYTYTPNQNVNGTDSFAYQVSDGGSAATGTISITIEPVNDDPEIAQGDSVFLTCQEDGGSEGVTLSAADIENDSLEWSIASQGDYGAAQVDAVSGYASYTPNTENYFGADSFTVSVSDGNGGSDSITVLVTVAPVNDPPSFSAGTDVTVDEDSGDYTHGGWIGAMSPGPENESAQTLTFTVTGNTNKALFAAGPAVSNDGTLTFTPADNAYGTAVITLSAKDSEGADSLDSHSFSMTVNPVNDAPVCTGLPAISGTLHNGQTLSATSGSWTDAADGDLATSWGYAYQWQSSASGTGAWSDIARGLRAPRIR